MLQKDALGAFAVSICGSADKERGDNLDYVAWRFWIDIGQTLATVAIGVYVWWDKRQTQGVKRINRIEAWQVEQGPKITALAELVTDRNGKCSDHEKRTNQLEKDHQVMQANIQNLPDKDDLAELTKQIGRLTEKLATVDGRLTGINRAVDLLNQHHLGIGK